MNKTCSVQEHTEEFILLRRVPSVARNIQAKESRLLNYAAAEDVCGRLWENLQSCDNVLIERELRVPCERGQHGRSKALTL